MKDWEIVFADGGRVYVSASTAVKAASIAASQRGEQAIQTRPPSAIFWKTNARGMAFIVRS